MESVAATAARTIKLPGLAADVLRNLVKGRTKITVEAAGYEEPFRIFIDVIKNVMLVVVACVLYSGSCRLCSTTMAPMVDDIPLFALIGFAVSIALGIYALRKLIKAAGKK